MERAKTKDKTKLHANLSPGKENYIEIGTGKNGLSFCYSIRQHDSDVEFYIDRGTEKENRQIFDMLAESKKDIEAAFGEPLEWERLEGKRTCYIYKWFSSGGYRDKERWPEIQDAMINAMIRLEKAFRPYIDKLPM